MEQLLQQIEAYKEEISSIIPNGEQSLEAYRIRFLGTKGIVKNLFQEMKQVPPEKKKEFGQILNDFKQLAESKYDESKTVNRQPSTVNQQDWSLPGDPITVG